MDLDIIYNEDCLETLKRLPDQSVNCCVTSPPYYGLRDYGTATWVGGDPNCDHKAAKLKSRYDYSLDTSLIQDGNRKGTDAPKYMNICPDCGAVKIDKQIGLEETPEQYVDKLVATFREVRRVLKDNGTLWLNLGDSYNGSGQDSGKQGREISQQICGRSRLIGEASPTKATRVKTLKPKDLIGIPWMVAFALRADGWYLRQDIIWHKPNPMPESVTDRCTKSHEYIFLLSKSKKYYYNANAIKTKMECSEHDKRSRQGRKRFPTALVNGIRGSHPDRVYEFANKRSVWTVNTKPYKDAHFATYPEKLIVDCIKAGCPEGGIVLDPFMGAGTTALVAYKLNRKFIGSELNSDYAKIAEKRLKPYLSQHKIFDSFQ